MTNTLLNISGKVDPIEVEVFDIVHHTVSELGISYLVVGASARDLVLHYAHGVNIIRATGDTDFAIQLRSWNEFNTVKSALLNQGFKETRQQQRLISPVGRPVDIVPFGEIEDQNSRIRWQPENVIEMHVLGFREALEHADRVRLRDNPPLDIPVVTMAGLSILKIIAWTDRSRDIRGKDAIDLLFLLKHYERIPAVTDRIFQTSGLLEMHDWDTALAGAQLLGADATQIMRPETVTYISALQEGEMLPLGIDRLIEEMSPNDEQFDRNKSFMDAFVIGLMGELGSE